MHRVAEPPSCIPPCPRGGGGGLCPCLPPLQPCCYLSFLILGIKKQGLFFSWSWQGWVQGDAWLPAGTIPSTLAEGSCSQTVLVLVREDPGVPRVLPMCPQLR